MLAIAIRKAFTVTLTTVPQLLLPARVAPDNRSYLSLFNLDASNTVMIAPDNQNNGAKPIKPGLEYWEEPGGVPSNAFWAWTIAGTAQLTVWEG